MNLINHAAISNKMQADGVQAISLNRFGSSLLHQLQLSIGRYLAFTSGGKVGLAAGITLTGAISGATARLGVVTVSTGSWSAGTAAGIFILYDQVGAFQAENLNWGTQLNVATILVDSSLPTAGTLTVGLKTPKAEDYVDLTHTIDMVNGPFLYQFSGFASNIRVTPAAFTAVNAYTIDIVSGVIT